LKKALIVISCVLLLFAGILFYYMVSQKPEEPKYTIELPDKFLKDLDLVDLKGDSISLLKFLGKPIVVNFWATWCLPCVSEMGSFETVRQEKRDSVYFVLISDEPVAKIKSFTTKKGYQLIYLKSKKPFGALGINKIPQTYFFDPKGVEKSIFRESIYSKIIREEIKKMN